MVLHGMSENIGIYSALKRKVRNITHSLQKEFQWFRVNFEIASVSGGVRGATNISE